MKRVTLKQVLAGLLFVFLVGVSVFISWARNALPASDIALQALNSDELVAVNEESGLITFEPLNAQPEIGFIFYPGGRVDYRAYAPILYEIAASGYFVALVPAPLNLAYFNVNAAKQVIVLFPEIQNWAVGGHSLGGVAAASYASTHPDIKGLVLWASYPADDSLLVMNTKVISIYGTDDGLATGDKIDNSRALLPDDTIFFPIEGGNHAQFGSYGPQAGDNEAAISPEEQWTQIAAATAEFLKELSK